MRKLGALAFMIVCPVAAADNVNSQSSAEASSSAQASSISQGGTGFGGMGGAGGMGGDANATGGTGIGHGGEGGVGQGGAGGTAFNTGNSQSVSVDGSKQAIYSPSGFAFAPMATAMCQGSTGVWASFIGGLGFASSRDIEWCRVMELGRLMAGLGRADLGVKILCKFDEYASQLDECKK